MHSWAGVRIYLLAWWDVTRVRFRDSSGWISAWKGQFHSVFFVLINVMQIRREFSFKKKKKERKKYYFLINKILLSDVS